MLAKCPKSYLLGFFLGDGSSDNSNSWGQYTFHVNEHDLPRVDVNAKVLGVSLNWRVSSSPKNKIATWPREHWDTLEIQRLRGYNGYTFRFNLLPPWTDENSFMEGIWDAEGSVRINSRKKNLFSFEVTNEGLRNDVFTILQKNGFDPSLGFRQARVRGGNRSKPSFRIYLKSRDLKRFKRLYSLQPYKQDQLDLMCSK